MFSSGPLNIFIIEVGIFYRSTSPICMYSEFPRSFLVSTVLIGLFIILVCLFGQILYTISSQVINDNFGFNDSSIIYFSAYILTNLLFLAHLGLYFGYKESLILDDQMLQVNQGLFNMQWRKQIPLENIFSISAARVAWVIITF